MDYRIGDELISTTGAKGYVTGTDGLGRLFISARRRCARWVRVVEVEKIGIDWFLKQEGEKADARRNVEGV